MKRLLLLGLVLAACLGATWSREIDPELLPGKTAIYTFSAADGTGFSSIRRHQCGTIGAAFEDGTGADATVATCANKDGTVCFDEQAFIADGDAVFVPRYPWLRVERVATGASDAKVYLSCGSNVAVTTSGGVVNASAIVDDLGCAPGESIRRDAGDVAWECYLPGAGGGGDNVFVQGVAAVDPDLENEGDLDPIRCTGVGAPDARCAAAEDVIFEVRQADALEANAANCGAGQYAQGVDTAGAAEGCTPDDDTPEAGDFGALAATSPITQSGGTISTSITSSRVLGRTTAGAGVIEQLTVSAPLSLAAGALGITQNAGTDVTVDLEEETHATEHSQGGADAITAENLASSCGSGATLEGDGTGGVVCGTDDGGGGGLTHPQVMSRVSLGF